MKNLQPFHLAFPVHDLKLAKDFYTNILGCTIGRSSDHWIDFNLFGHQVVAHLSPDELSKTKTRKVDNKQVPVTHFGIVLECVYRDISKKITEMEGEEKDAYILMEKIKAKTHQAILVVNGKVDNLTSVSEIGRFGICFPDNGVVQSNEDVGYLVRTKAKNVNEGGVCSGFACLNSLAKA